MSIPTIPDAPPVQQFDKIPLRSMGDEAVFEDACNDFWPRVKPFAEDLTATGEWIGTVYAAMGEAYQQTAQAVQAATTKAGEAAQSAQQAGVAAQTAQQAIAALEQGAIVNGDPATNTAWPSVRTAQELALRDADIAEKRNSTDTSFPRYDVASSTPTGSTITLDLSQGQVFRHGVTGTRTFAFSNVPGTGRAMTVVLHLFNASLPSRTINWPSDIIWQGGTAPEFNGTAAVVVFLWTGSEWMGSVGVDNA